MLVIKVKEEEIECLKMKDETLTSSFQVMQEEFGTLQNKNKVIIDFVLPSCVYNYLI